MSLLNEYNKNSISQDWIPIRPNERISVFRVKGLKILGRVDTQTCLMIFFWNKYQYMHFERQNAFQNA